MDLIIITCPHLASDRLPMIIDRLKGAIASELISTIRLICAGDEGLSLETDIPYKSDKWCNDINLAWPFFKQNILMQLDACGYSIDLDHVSRELSPVTSFPSRELYSSEHSIALRHIHALNTISKLDSPCLVLEDDFAIRNEDLFRYFLRSFRVNCKDLIFYDLCDEYIPMAVDTAMTYSDGPLRYSVKAIAVTRTLMAYAMSPKTAKIMLSSFNHYSLPVDMQFQVILATLGIPGMSLINSPFAHGSKVGLVASSIGKF